MLRTCQIQEKWARIHTSQEVWRMLGQVNSRPNSAAHSWLRSFHYRKSPFSLEKLAFSSDIRNIVRNVG